MSAVTWRKDGGCLSGGGHCRNLRNPCHWVYKTIIPRATFWWLPLRSTLNVLSPSDIKWHFYNVYVKGTRNQIPSRRGDVRGLLIG